MRAACSIWAACFFEKNMTKIMFFILVEKGGMLFENRLWRRCFSVRRPRSLASFSQTFFSLVVERTGALFQKPLERHLGEDIFLLCGREEWRAFCESASTKRMFLRFTVERSVCFFGKLLFDKKGGVYFFLKNSFLIKDDFFSLPMERIGALFWKTSLTQMISRERKCDSFRHARLARAGRGVSSRPDSV